MIARGQPILQDDLDTLATLANSRLNLAVDYVFTAMAGADKITLPTDISPKATSGIGGWQAGSKVTLWLFAYKTILGVKYYTWTPLVKAFVSAPGPDNFSMTWTWVSAMGDKAPDGYLVVIPFFDVSWTLRWQDIGNVQTLTEDGSFSNPNWFVDALLGQNLTGPGPLTTKDLPCSHGAWLKTLNSIRLDLLLRTDISTANAGDVSGLSTFHGNTDYFPPSDPVSTIHTLGIAGICSGPWCVSVANSILTCYRARDYSYGDGLQGCYTQCYKGIKFYFRSADAPSGINITVVNQLLGFTIGSDPLLVAGPAHFTLSLVSCSTGHIKIQDTGGGTIRFESDVVAGMTYDCSFTVADSFGPVNSQDRVMDFIFTTTGTTASVVAAGIELNNDVQMATVPDSYFEIQFNNPTLNGSSSVPSTSCGQLVVTENNDVPGIWVANTLPTMGLMTYLDVDLPQYLDASQVSSRRLAMSDSLPYIASVDNRGALWPVFRDTDFTPDSVLGKPVTGSKAWQVLATKSVQSGVFSDNVPPYEPTEHLWNVIAVFVPIGTTDVLFMADDPAVTVYVGNGHFPTLASNDGSDAGGTWFSLAASVPGFTTGGTWNFSIYNPTGAAIPVVSKFVVISGTPPNGTFFPTGVTDAGKAYGLPETVSYHFGDPTNSNSNPIPLLGYCVYSITARRLPIDNGNGIALAPTEGTTDLSIQIGVMSGFGFEVAGTFVPLQVITIPAGQASVTMNVFLPVLSGTPLAYQCAEEIVIRASVNFQPMMHSLWNPTTAKVSGVDTVIGYHNGLPFFDKDKALLFYKGGAITSPILLPVCVEIYNDLFNLLTLLP